MAVKTTPEYIDLLNQGVEREFQVAVQYFLQHAKMEKIIKKEIPENILLDKTTYDAVGKILHEISIQEMKHAAAIMERIYYLGGEATTKAGKIVIGDKISEFAKLGVKAEEEALVLYRKIINALGNWATGKHGRCSKKSTARKKNTSSNSKSTRLFKMRRRSLTRCPCQSGAKSLHLTITSC